ncbi:hypothetical protein NEHOM01_1703 [Nematocida homosporus]|uniref:uncharacterized protein n=1 Tax=Nematocida homosporus TaxID=1912981 RepID=UPI00221F05FB|nr:uncharacterized protein NEHOM01_1703 [Nematocida homosporus]KAI5186783.1 hypothetical protein NEHOM01_1703 [Nematocida homosporus]
MNMKLNPKTHKVKWEYIDPTGYEESSEWEKVQKDILTHQDNKKEVSMSTKANRWFIENYFLSMFVGHLTINDESGVPDPSLKPYIQWAVDNMVYPNAQIDSSNTERICYDQKKDKIIEAIHADIKEHLMQWAVIKCNLDALDQARTDHQSVYSGNYTNVAQRFFALYHYQSRYLPFFKSFIETERAIRNKSKEKDVQRWPDVITPLEKRQLIERITRDGFPTVLKDAAAAIKDYHRERSIKDGKMKSESRQPLTDDNLALIQALIDYQEDLITYAALNPDNKYYQQLFETLSNPYISVMTDDRKANVQQKLDELFFEFLATRPSLNGDQANKDINAYVWSGVVRNEMSPLIVHSDALKQHLNLLPPAPSASRRSSIGRRSSVSRRLNNFTDLDEDDDADIEITSELLQVKNVSEGKNQAAADYKSRKTIAKAASIGIAVVTVLPLLYATAFATSMTIFGILIFSETSKLHIKIGGLLIVAVSFLLVGIVLFMHKLLPSLWSSQSQTDSTQLSKPKFNHKNIKDWVSVGLIGAVIFAIVIYTVVKDEGVVRGIFSAVKDQQLLHGIVFGLLPLGAGVWHTYKQKARKSTIYYKLILIGFVVILTLALFTANSIQPSSHTSSIASSSISVHSGGFNPNNSKIYV